MPGVPAEMEDVFEKILPRFGENVDKIKLIRFAEVK
ncbi:MAG TPA: competence/damage-inducible protein A, partial [Aquificaceae bacterium]|nr:competence/damage-inducible protein A [Aquificaceae bacterium]